MNYKGWDVHSYTTETRQVAKGLDCFGACSEERFYSALNLALDWWKDHDQLVDSRKVLDCIKKFKTRWHGSVGGWRDPDLDGANCAELFCRAAELVQRERGLVVLFLETLQDIENTCVQGDSHRLIQFLSGVRE
jgi:hypothetical protein